MTLRLNNGRLCAWALTLTAIVNCWLGMDRSAHTDDRAVAKVPAEESFQYVGADRCKFCHGAPPKDVKGADDWVSLAEFPLWEQDVHSHAFKALECPRALEMERQLGWKVGAAKSSAECLACHSTHITPKSADRSFLFDEQQIAAANEKGVSCEACHGAASAWLDLHSRPGAWRNSDKRKSGELYSEKGMTNLRDPVTRTEVCLSCHLGDMNAGKFVTHAMYAAGHPPLSAFEVETFTARMPPHWKRTKLDPPKPFERTRAVALEGLMAVRASVKLLEDAARQASEAPADSSRLGLADFALYDCAACHHELKIPSRRQERGYFAAAPGRPPLKYWSLPLATLGLAIQPSAETNSASLSLKKALAPIHSAITNRPFGDPHNVRDAAAKTLSQIDAAIKSLASPDKQPFGADGKAARRLLDQLCTIADSPSLDFESAQVLVGAIHMVYDDLKNAGMAPRVDENPFQALESTAHFDLKPAEFHCDPDTSPAVVDYGADFDPSQFAERLRAARSWLESHWPAK